MPLVSNEYSNRTLPLYIESVACLIKVTNNLGMSVVGCTLYLSTLVRYGGSLSLRQSPMSVMTRLFSA